MYYGIRQQFMQTIREIDGALVHDQLVAHLWPHDAVNEMVVRHSALENGRAKAGRQVV